MTDFWLGLACGVMLTIPLVAVFSRSTARRVRRLEAVARSAERLREQATMTGGLAHEIKNPLSSINLNLQLLQEDLHAMQRESLSPELSDQLSRFQRRFESLGRELQRLRDILDDFLRFAGRVKLDPSTINLNELIDELADFFTPQAHAAGVQLRVQPFPEPAVVHADAALLKQAVLNLMLNATQAMEDAGRQRARGRRAEGTGEKTGEAAGDASAPRGELILRVAAAKLVSKGKGKGKGTGRRATDQDAGQPPHHGGVSGDALTTRGADTAPRGAKLATIPAFDLHVTDTGPGMDAEQRDRIFEPYYSTKRSGTGLGLPTSRRIIEEHGGLLTVHSEPGRGTDFVITLRALDQAVAAPEPKPETEPLRDAR